LDVAYNLTLNKVNGYMNFVNLGLISLLLLAMTMNKSVYLAGILAAIMLAGAAEGITPTFAEDDENEATEREGSSGLLGESEAGESEDDEGSEGSAIGGLSGLVLYGVIAAVLATIGYTGYKVFAGRKKAVRTHP
jgi:hypothetical protein